MANRISPSRWYLKKAARRGLATTAWACGWMALRARMAPSPSVRALTYHRFGNVSFDPFSVEPGDFRDQMRWLADHGMAISLADLEAFLAGKKLLKDGSVIVTVDDGFRSVYTDMLPILREFAVPAVAFVSPRLIGEHRATRESRQADQRNDYLTWDELEHLVDAGVTIGSHGWSHRSLGRITPSEARDEAFRSREVLQARLGLGVNSFAYPYGTRADFSRATTAILADAGYTTAFTSQHGGISSRSAAIELPRIKVEGGESLRMFRLLCRGGMDGWRLVDQTLWHLQRPMQ